MRHILVVASVSSVVLALALTAALAIRAWAQPAPQVPPPPVVADPQPNIPKRAHPIPTLTPEQQAKAKELFASDPRAQTLFRGHEYVVGRLAPWLNKGEARIIGVLMDVSLRQPATIEGDWPFIRRDETETTSPPYKEETFRATVRGGLKFYVLVDLQREKLVSIDPFQPQEIILPSGSNAPHPPPPNSAAPMLLLTYSELKGVVAVSHLIVKGQVLQGSEVPIDIGGRRPFTHHIHPVKIIRGFKGAAPGDTISVGEMVTIEGDWSLESGRPVYLFLERVDHGTYSYTVPYDYFTVGPQGQYYVRNGLIEPKGDAHLATTKKFKGVTEEVFVQELLKAIGQQSVKGD